MVHANFGGCNASGKNKASNVTHGPPFIFPVINITIDTGDASSIYQNPRSGIVGLKVKKLKKVEKPDFLVLVMMQMKVEVEKRAHDCRENATNRNQLTEVIVWIAAEYFATSVEREKKKIKKKKKRKMNLVDRNSRSSRSGIINSSNISNSKQEGGGGGKMGEAHDIISCTIIPCRTSPD